MAIVLKMNNILYIHALKVVIKADPKHKIHHKGLVTLYSEKTLSEIFEESRKLRSQKANIEKFGAMQCNIMSRCLSPFKYDLCSTSLVETDRDGSPISIDNYLYNFIAPKDEVLDSYLAIADKDTVSQLVFLNPGCALSDKDDFLGTVYDERFMPPLQRPTFTPPFRLIQETH